MPHDIVNRLRYTYEAHKGGAQGGIGVFLEAADEIESLRRTLERIASKNDLSAFAKGDLQTHASAAFGALAECEQLARNALDD